MSTLLPPSSPCPLWLSIEPGPSQTRLSLSVPLLGTTLRARLPTPPAHPGALGHLLEALAAWYGQRLCAVLDADASEVQRCPERWARLLGDLDERVEVRWTAVGDRQRDRFLEGVGDFHSARRLVSFAATGQK
jgi:hypothetical protein